MVADIPIKLFSLVDSIVELYLGTIIKPFLGFHETFYAGLNKTLRKLLDDNKDKIADWFTANFITYVRTVLVIPTLVLLSGNHQILPAIIVILVDFGDFLDGVVARYWVDVKKEREQEEVSKDKGPRPSSPTSDDDSFGTSLRDNRDLAPMLVLSFSFLGRNCNDWLATGYNVVASFTLEQNLWGFRRCRL